MPLNIPRCPEAVKTSSNPEKYDVPIPSKIHYTESNQKDHTEKVSKRHSKGRGEKRSWIRRPRDLSVRVPVARLVPALFLCIWQ